ncbi:MBL fold metallo-hydrolase [Croceicoccus sp. BE223]|uniref:MBL fold metallo-hydrolase n=1 Tax=Croceicoccus sp. BE223 TaxID=2817716 RepID=UPI002854E73F|nr:MBL fold metallo-hydrolase [Croceicoccus sp. BE223]MDR7102379.1 glyoxylase-like metal-dependent hydrolase (beta-lactamase superfamily II) [Croceicoccus sp. BE223]
MIHESKAPGRNLSWHVGCATITCIVESTFDGGLEDFMPFATPEAVGQIAWLGPEFVTAEGKLKFSIHALVIETEGRRILVDTCVGNEKDRPAFAIWHMQQYAFLHDLLQAGFPPETIDVVLCTHLHLDHVGWNTMRVGEEWVPTFPNARYLIGKAEFAAFERAIVETSGGDVMRDLDRAVLGDSIAPVIEAGLVDFVASDHRICDTVRLLSTPGHTAGHVSVEVSSDGERAIITGDFIHHPCQLAHPDWSITSDFDPDQSTLTRERVFAEIAGGQTLLIGTHWPAPTAGHIDRDGAAYRLR